MKKLNWITTTILVGALGALALGCNPKQNLFRQQYEPARQSDNKTSNSSSSPAANSQDRSKVQHRLRSRTSPANTTSPEPIRMAPPTKAQWK